MNADNLQNTHLVFLHGWGQSSRIWYQQQRYFPHQTHFIDLPGHGGADDVAQEQWLSRLEKQLLAIPCRNIILIGWSLGGQLAMALGQRLRSKNIIRGLVLVSSTPSFRQHADWSFGCADEVWRGFSDATAQQDSKLMQRFFQMMLHGDILSRSERNLIIKEAVNSHSPASFTGLTIGLGLLSELDLRENIQSLKVPTLILHGQQDIIVPLQAGQYLAGSIPGSELIIFDDCGHAPFLTHHAKFNQLLEQWCKKLSV